MLNTNKDDQRVIDTITTTTTSTTIADEGNSKVDVSEHGVIQAQKEEGQNSLENKTVEVDSIANQVEKNNDLTTARRPKRSSDFDQWRGTIPPIMLPEMSLVSSWQDSSYGWRLLQKNALLGLEDFKKNQGWFGWALGNGIDRTNFYSQLINGAKSGFQLRFIMAAILEPVDWKNDPDGRREEGRNVKHAICGRFISNPDAINARLASLVFIMGYLNDKEHMTVDQYKRSLSHDINNYVKIFDSARLGRVSLIPSMNDDEVTKTVTKLLGKISKIESEMNNISLTTPMTPGTTPAVVTSTRSSMFENSLALVEKEAILLKDLRSKVIAGLSLSESRRSTSLLAAIFNFSRARISVYSKIVDKLDSNYELASFLRVVFSAKPAEGKTKPEGHNVHQDICNELGFANPELALKELTKMTFAGATQGDIFLDEKQVNDFSHDLQKFVSKMKEVKPGDFDFHNDFFQSFEREARVVVDSFLEKFKPSVNFKVKSKANSENSDTSSEMNNINLTTPMKPGTTPVKDGKQEVTTPAVVTSARSSMFENSLALVEKEAILLKDLRSKVIAGLDKLLQKKSSFISLFTYHDDIRALFYRGVVDTLVSDDELVSFLRVILSAKPAESGGDDLRINISHMLGFNSPESALICLTKHARATQGSTFLNEVKVNSLAGELQRIFKGRHDVSLIQNNFRNEIEDFSKKFKSDVNSQAEKGVITALGLNQ